MASFYLCSLGGHFGLFGAGLNEVLVHGECVNYSGWRLPRPQFEESERSASMESGQCTAVDRVSSKMCSINK